MALYGWWIPLLEIHGEGGHRYVPSTPFTPHATRTSLFYRRPGRVRANERLVAESGRELAVDPIAGKRRI